MSLEIAVTGMNAARKELDIISNNIANSGTVGFKQSRVEFADVYTKSDKSLSNNATGQGVRVEKVRQQFSQGAINTSDSSLDLAISGNGFFRLSDNANGVVYSRAGMFGIDREGFVVNAAGQSLTGYLANEEGGILPTLGKLQIDTSDLTPSASTRIDLGMNLSLQNETLPNTFDPNDPNSFHYSTSTNIYDSQGSPQVVNMYFRQEDPAANPNSWNAYLFVNDQSINPDLDANAATVDPITLNFTDEGILESVNGVPDTLLTTAQFSASPTSAPMDLDINFSQFTQFDGPSGVNEILADGYSSGRLSNLFIDDAGSIIGRYSNGSSKAMGQVALANFANVEGLRPLGDTAWAETSASGAAAVGEPGSASLGTVESNALEASNTDLAKQLVSMIGTQRNFQANAQVISVTDAITQTIINIRR